MSGCQRLRMTEMSERTLQRLCQISGRSTMKSVVCNAIVAEPLSWLSVVTFAS